RMLRRSMNPAAMQQSAPAATSSAPSVKASPGPRAASGSWATSRSAWVKAPGPATANAAIPSSPVRTSSPAPSAPRSTGRPARRRPVDRQRQVLPRLAGGAEPGVVGDVDEEIGPERRQPPPERGDDVLVADHRPERPPAEREGGHLVPAREVRRLRHPFAEP